MGKIKSNWKRTDENGNFVADIMIDYIPPTKLGFETDDVDLEAMYCGKWYYVYIGFKRDIGHMVAGILSEQFEGAKVERAVSPYRDIKVYFYANRLSRSGGKIKIDHARYSLRWIYFEGPCGGCTSIPVDIFKHDLEAGIIHELILEELAEYEDSGLMAQDIETDRRRSEARW